MCVRKECPTKNHTLTVTTGAIVGPKTNRHELQLLSAIDFALVIVRSGEHRACLDEVHLWRK